MKIPKYIDRALRLRTKYACLLDDQCRVIDEWLERNRVECGYEDTHGGVELYVNPHDSESRVRECIKEK